MDQSKLKKQEQQRKKKWREDLKRDPEIYKEYLAKERFRKSHAKAVRIASQSSSQSSPSASTPAVSNSAFSTKQSRHRSLTKADKNLPQSPRKKAEIIKNLAGKYKIRIQLKESRGRPKKDLDDEKKAWLVEYLSRSDMTYTNPGRADNVYIGKVNGERTLSNFRPTIKLIKKQRLS